MHRSEPDGCTPAYKFSLFSRVGRMSTGIGESDHDGLRANLKGCLKGLLFAMMCLKIRQMATEGAVRSAHSLSVLARFLVRRLADFVSSGAAGAGARMTVTPGFFGGVDRWVWVLPRALFAAPITLLWTVAAMAQQVPQTRHDRDLHAQADLWRQRLGHARPFEHLEGRANRCLPATAMPDQRDDAALYRRAVQARAGAAGDLRADHQLATGGWCRAFEAPVNLGYSQRNRSAACRIPMYSPSPKAKRVEFRCPDPSCNPYLAFAAMLMAGLDGVQNRLDPGEPIDKNLYDLPPEELAKVPSAPGSLEEFAERARSRPRVSAEGRRLHPGRRRDPSELQALARGRRDAAAPAPLRVLPLLRRLIALRRRRAPANYRL